jgi:PST family polysaccharide transporter
VVQVIDGISFARMTLRLVPPLVACVPMVAAVVGTRLGLRRIGVEHQIYYLAAEVLVGALVYTGAALVIARSASRELLRLLRHALARRRGGD